MAFTLLPFPFIVIYLWHLSPPLYHPVDSAKTGVSSEWYWLSHSDGPPPSPTFRKLLIVSVALVPLVTGASKKSSHSRGDAILELHIFVLALLSRFYYLVAKILVLFPSLPLRGISLFFANSALMGNGDDVFLGDAHIIVALDMSRRVKGNSQEWRAFVESEQKGVTSNYIEFNVIELYHLL
ncbi:hypothetical protein Tco_1370227 [Tanacetum coccineum]